MYVVILFNKSYSTDIYVYYVFVNKYQSIWQMLDFLDDKKT